MFSRKPMYPLPREGIFPHIIGDHDDVARYKSDTSLKTCYDRKYMRVLTYLVNSQHPGIYLKCICQRNFLLAE